MDNFSILSSITRINSLVVLVTGGSDLAVSVCCRLVDEVNDLVDLSIIICESSLKKTQDAIQKVSAHACTKSRRVEFDYVVVDFLDMHSVYDACKGLSKQYMQIDQVFLCHTQYPEVEGINHGKIYSDIGNDFPTFLQTKNSGLSKDGLGRIFQANVFAPYFFVSTLIPLLRHGKVIWFSSAYNDHDVFNDDLQLLNSSNEYQKSQRLIDLLYLATYEDMLKEGIEQYLVQPGVGQNYSLVSSYFLVNMVVAIYFFFKALFGSPYHSRNMYKAACPAVHCGVDSDQQEFKIGSTMSRNQKIVYESISGIGSEEVESYLSMLGTEWSIKFRAEEKEKENCAAPPSAQEGSSDSIEYVSASEIKHEEEDDLSLVISEHLGI